MATRLERTAYHEAGHAVMAIRYKISFKYVTIEPSESEDTLGHVKFREYPTWLDLENVDERTNRWSEKRILVSLAGQAAECHLIGRENWIGAGQDWENAVSIAAKRFDPASKTLGPYLNYLRERVKEEIASLQNWDDIEALASELLEQKRLSARAVRQLLRDRFNQRFGAS
ncbi:MAG: hypothetical protein P8J33_10955 [Pirellulaceae bacterium]|nr:hypothetical protein [Pirellulaceae bacterium]